VSTLWTPSGEHHVPRPGEPGAGTGDSGQGRPPGRGGPEGSASDRNGDQSLTGQGPDEWEPTPEEARQAQEELEVMREQLAQAPAELVIANHAMGLWELAALHLSQKPPQLAQAQLAIDALSALVDGLHGRLGEDEKSLRDGLAQIRMAFVQIHNAEQARQGSPEAGR
jgi:Domain of unknown function (DUF1844)